MKTVIFRCGGRVHRVMPGIALACEIEAELGGLAALAARLKGGTWCAAEVVTLTHILLSAAGAEADWGKLGDGMMEEGLSACAAEALAFLNRILDGDAT
jgi:hypothetical protein